MLMIDGAIAAYLVSGQQSVLTITARNLAAILTRAPML